MLVVARLRLQQGWLVCEQRGPRAERRGSVQRRGARAGERGDKGGGPRHGLRLVPSRDERHRLCLVRLAVPLRRDTAGGGGAHPGLAVVRLRADRPLLPHALPRAPPPPRAGAGHLGGRGGRGGGAAAERRGDGGAAAGEPVSASRRRVEAPRHEGASHQRARDDHSFGGLTPALCHRRLALLLGRRSLRPRLPVLPGLPRPPPHRGHVDGGADVEAPGPAARLRADHVAARTRHHPRRHARRLPGETLGFPAVAADHDPRLRGHDGCGSHHALRPSVLGGPRRLCLPQLRCPHGERAAEALVGRGRAAGTRRRGHGDLGHAEPGGELHRQRLRRLRHTAAV
mmetsp:Transcript_39205/g.111157  ORF Transcript_39205/g.111157 Transcript_39205/m.111157 type:complete len:342 (-) Transcript_39205:754-1779(-)